MQPSTGSRIGESVKVLVVGLGSIGRRHARNLKSIVPNALIAALRREGSDVLNGEGRQLVERVFTSLEEALSWGPEIAVVSTPSSLHLDSAIPLAQAGVHLLVEKPISNSLAGTDDLIETCAKSAVVLAVGYNLRFDPVLRVVRDALRKGRIGRLLSFRAEVGQYLPEWRPGRDYRLTPTARAELGGGVLLELSHEFDYARWIAGEIAAVTARASPVGVFGIDVEEIAEVLLDFTDGSIGSIHLDMVQRAPVRRCSLIGTEGTIVWDALGARADMYVNGVWSTLADEDASHRNSSYIAELNHFLECVVSGHRPLVDGRDARRTLEVAVAARVSAEHGRLVWL